MGAVQNDGGGRRWKRVMRLLGVAVVVAALVGVAGWKWWLPHYRPTLRPGEAYAIDVSHHQGPIAWESVARDGIRFAYLKATEGGDHRDAAFAANLAGARAAGLTVGAYHFFTLCRSGKDQAAHFLKIAPPTDSMLAPAIDVEFGGNCAARPPAKTLLREIDEFVRIVEEAWNRPLITYVMHDTERRHGIEAHLGRRRWQRHLITRPGHDNWAVWQLSFTARVAGVRGPVDLNVVKVATAKSG